MTSLREWPAKVEALCKKVEDGVEHEVTEVIDVLGRCADHAMERARALFASDRPELTVVKFLKVEWQTLEDKLEKLAGVTEENSADDGKAPAIATAVLLASTQGTEAAPAPAAQQSDFTPSLDEVASDTPYVRNSADAALIAPLGTEAPQPEAPVAEENPDSEPVATAEAAPVAEEPKPGN